MQEVTYYRTEDGKVHETRKEAEEHEKAILVGVEVERYLAHWIGRLDEPPSDRAVTRRRNVVTDFLLWKHGMLDPAGPTLTEEDDA